MTDIPRELDSIVAWRFDRMSDEEIDAMFANGWTVQQIRISRRTNDGEEVEPWDSGLYLAPPNWKPSYNDAKMQMENPDRAVAITGGGALLRHEERRLDRVNILMKKFDERAEIPELVN